MAGAGLQIFARFMKRVVAIATALILVGVAVVDNPVMVYPMLKFKL